MEKFKMETPVVVCRWRLSDGTLPLENRHLRALAARKVPNGIVTPMLIAWAKQHLEWTLQDGSADCPNGVLMLVLDKTGKAAMTVGPYRELAHTSANDLLRRAINAREEAASLGVSPEDLWVAKDGGLVWGTSTEFTPSGASSLIADLSRTMGLPVTRDENLLASLRIRGFTNEEVFLVSDEHGVVVSSDHSGTRASKFAASYKKLFNMG